MPGDVVLLSSPSGECNQAPGSYVHTEISMIAPARIDLEMRRLRFRLRRRLLGEKSLFEAAARVWEVAPASEFRYAPSIFLPGELDRVRQVDPATTWDIERRRAMGDVFEKPPVRAFQFRNAALYQGAIISSGRAYRVLPHEADPAPSREFPVIDVDRGALAASYLGLRYFGHWMRDDVALTVLGEDFGETISPTPPIWHPDKYRYSHIPEYAKFFELPWRMEENVRFGELVIFDDEEYSQSKIARIRTVRDRVRRKMGPPPPGKRVFIMREVDDSSSRMFADEARLAERLAERGFDLITPSSMTVEEIAAALYGAETIVSPEGSQMSHSVYFAGDGACFLAVTSPDRFNSPFKQWLDSFNMRYGFVVGDAGERGFTVDPDRVMKTLDLMEKARGPVA